MGIPWGQRVCPLVADDGCQGVNGIAIFWDDAPAFRTKYRHLPHGELLQLLESRFRAA
jgi:hypothetical protein